MAAAHRLFVTTMGENGDLNKVAMAGEAPSRRPSMRSEPILVRQVRYLNNVAEQDRRANKNLIRPVFSSNHSAPPVP